MTEQDESELLSLVVLEGQVQILDWLLHRKPLQEVLRGRGVKYDLRII